MKPDDLQRAKDSCQENYEFPCAVGALDCKHTQILKPGLHSDEYICHKHVPMLTIYSECVIENIHVYAFSN